MKKYLIVLAAVVLGLASCKKDNVDYTSIKFKNSELTITEGSSLKLQVLYEPTSITEAPVCTWKSSDTDAVTVDQNGNITAVGIGEANVTATYKELKAVCHITVKSFYDMLEWADCGLFGELGDSVGVEYQHWDADDQCYYKTQNFLGTFYIWSTDITFINGKGFSGAGFFMDIEVPVGVIQEGDWAGYYYMPTLLFTDTVAPTSEGATPAGALTDAAEWHEFLYNDSTYDGDGSFKGAPVHYYDFDNKESTDFIGFVKEGWMSNTKSGIFYEMGITWFDMEEGLYGLKMEQNEEGKWQFVQPYTFTDRFDMEYSLVPSNAASASHKKAPIKLNKSQVRLLKEFRAKDKLSKK